jgi:hypothetical protein
VSALGERAPTLQFARPTVIAFLRHVGCPFAEASMRELVSLADAYAQLDVFAVSHAPDGDTRDWCAAIGGCGRVRVIIDVERAHYRAWGVPRTDWRHFAGRRALVGVWRMLLRGIRNRRASGTRFQSAATFAVDGGGVIVWKHVPAHAGQLADLAAARLALIRS